MPLCGGGGICVVFNVSTAMEYNMCFQTPSVFSQLLSLVQGRLFGCFIQQFYYQCYFLDSRTTKEVPHNNWPVSIIVSHAMRNSEVIDTHPHTHMHLNSHTLSAESRSYGVFLPEFMCVRWEHKTTIIKGRLELPCSLGLGRWLQHFRVETKWSAFDSGPKHDITRWMREDTFYCFHLCFLDGIQERNIPPTSTSIPFLWQCIMGDLCV